MKPETKVVLAMERFAREQIRWARDEIFLFEERNLHEKRVELCEAHKADFYKVCEMEQELIDRRIERSKKLCNW